MLWGPEEFRDWPGPWALHVVSPWLARTGQAVGGGREKSRTAGCLRCLGVDTPTHWQGFWSPGQACWVLLSDTRLLVLVDINAGTTGTHGANGGWEHSR